MLLNVEVRTVKINWTLLVMKKMGYGCILGLSFMKFAGTHVNFLDPSITFEHLNKSIEEVQEDLKLYCYGSLLNKAEQK